MDCYRKYRLSSLTVNTNAAKTFTLRCDCRPPLSARTFTELLKRHLGAVGEAQHLLIFCFREAFYSPD